MTTRRGFLAGAGALAGVGLSGCGAFSGKWLSKARSSTYWCTWDTEYMTMKSRLATGELKFPGDQGTPRTRDNMNDSAIFGPKGWVNLFPETRSDMMFLIDGGWDVTLGIGSGPKVMHAFGRFAPDRDRFPSLGINDSDNDRLREFARRVECTGWKGLGVWVACQSYLERPEAPQTYAQLSEDIKRRLDASAYAGVKYWKVDWGVHNFHVWYRRLMSELKERYYPELIVDHCRGFNNAINGQVDPHLKPNDEFRNVGRTGRILGNADYDAVTREIEEIMEFTDVFRTYDSAPPLTTATMIERAVWEIRAADKSSSRAVVNTEDEPMIALGLGIELSMMRAPCWEEPAVPTPRPRHKRLAEDARCVFWQRLAPAFGSDTAAKIRYSEKAIREDWRFKPNECWFTGPNEKYYHQSAPAVVTRGLPLPEVRGTDGEVPYVLASRHPNGALAVSVMPVLNEGRGSRTPLADIRLDAVLEPGVPLAVFGLSRSLTLTDGTDGASVFARDLYNGKWIDVTSLCRRAEGRIVLPGEELAKIGASMNPPGDDSQPGAVVEVG